MFLTDSFFSTFVFSMVPEMLQKCVLYILPDKLNQDKLEEHLERQRSKLGCNENPNLKEYGETELKLQVAKSVSIRAIRSNTRGKHCDDEEQIDITDTTMLPKRKNK